jgi:phosphoglucomutase
VRHLHCAAGIVVTASHNPKEYNGYKVYGMDGGQITDSLAGEISGLIQNVEPIDSVKTVDFETALADGRIKYIDDTVLDAYVGSVLRLSGDLTLKDKEALKVVYSPIHGAGLVPVTRVLKEAGFLNVHVVEQQKMPDTEFSTVKSPNPEEREALSLAIGLAKEQKADVVIATDPDSDRLGIAVRDSEGQYVFMNGNQLGCLLLDNCLRSRKARNSLKPEDYVVKTIVSTRMADAMAKGSGVRAFNVLTGFKYIGEKIKEIETTGNGDFIFGFEESYGYLSGTFVRDKDAVIAALLTCEAAAHCKKSGLTMLEALNGLFESFGYYQESLKSYTLPGKDGVMKISALMDHLRSHTTNQICGRQIIATEDYLSLLKKNESGVEEIHLPKSNVLRYELDNDAWLAVRPSGTEPKLKIYIGVKGASAADSDAQIKAIEIEADKLVGELTA